MALSMTSTNRLGVTQHDTMDNIKQIFCKEFGVDTSEFQMRKEDLERTPNSHFIDEIFPPTKESLCHNWEEITDPGTKKSWSLIEWLRPCQFLKLSPGEKVKLFDTIEPNDIKQGILGDCYFLSSLSSLAEREQLIKRLFETKDYQENGLYAIWINIDGEWRLVVIDDYIPCRNGQPAFTRSNGNELWVLLLEKAYAKAYGSYYKIEGGNPAVALRDLTGAPYVNFDEKDPEKMFEFLELHDNNGKGDILTCYTPSTEIREAQMDVGLYSGHAYSILDVRRVKTQDGNEHRILCIRNPWGKGEWQGEWSDNDNKMWNNYTMKQVTTFKREEDGSFWMGINDFCKYFEGVGACQIQGSAKYNSISFKLQNSTSAIIKLQVLHNTKHLTISLNQKDQRHYNNDESKYKYSFATLIMVQKQQKGFKWVGGEFDVERNMMIKTENLPQGEYYILVEMMWCQTHYRNLVVSCYSDQETKFSFIQQGMDFNQALHQSIKSYCLENVQNSVGNPNSKIKINKYNGDQIGRINGSDFGLLFFYFYNQSWNTCLYQKITFTKLAGYDLPKEYSDKDNIEIAIPPQKEQVFVLKFSAIKDYRTEYSFKSNMQMMNKDQCPITPNPSVFLANIWENELQVQENTAAKDRKLQSTNFSLGQQSVDSEQSSVSVMKCEVSLINALASLVAPCITDWSKYIFRFTIVFLAFLLLFSFDNCNFFDMIIVMTCYILFQCQVMTRNRLRRMLLLIMLSIASSFTWFILYPKKWNSVDAQYDMIGKGMQFFIPIIELSFIVIKFYLCIFYWKLFVNYDELIHEVYNRFNLDSKKEIMTKV